MFHSDSILEYDLCVFWVCQIVCTLSVVSCCTLPHHAPRAPYLVQCYTTMFPLPPSGLANLVERGTYEYEWNCLTVWSSSAFSVAHIICFNHARGTGFGMYDEIYGMRRQLRGCDYYRLKLNNKPHEVPSAFFAFVGTSRHIV